MACSPTFNTVAICLTVEKGLRKLNALQSDIFIPFETVQFLFVLVMRLRKEEWLRS